MGLLDKFKKKNEINKEEKAIEVVTQILKAIHSKEYEKIMDCVDESKNGDLTTLLAPQKILCKRFSTKSRISHDQCA